MKSSMTVTISEETRRRIEESLRNWNDLNSPARTCMFYIGFVKVLELARIYEGVSGW